MEVKNKALLIILDGWGLAPTEKGNAPLLAKTPILDYVYATYPKTSISASGLEVGLNPGEVGNSEVGHLNLGSGRVVWENLPRINQAIESGDFDKNPALLQAIEHAKKNNSNLHLWGLVSDGGVHSHINHLIALIDLAARNKVKNVLVHFVTDGRDTAPEAALTYLSQLEEAFKKFGVGRIASVSGRYFAMDRDKNWDRVKKAYEVMTGTSQASISDAKSAIEAAYKAKQTDEFVEPVVVGEGGAIASNDAVIFFNFRADRSRQMLDLLTTKGSEPFAHGDLTNLFIATITRYQKNQTAPVVFEKVDLQHVLAELVAAKGIEQFHVAETEKFAHVTYFFNGGAEKPYEGETQAIVPSKKVATYDKAPEMSAAEITEKLGQAIEKGYPLIVVNYANGDMVGHTGILEAAVKACEVTDGCLGEVLDKASQAGYRVVLTADHGNCEVMINESTSKPNKEHTSNPVPFVHLDFSKTPFQPGSATFSADDYFQYAAGSPVGILADVASSVLAILGVEQPAEMAGMDLTIAL